MLALCCDYRIMTSKSKCVIGLNESMLGIVAPPWLCHQYIDTIGLRQAELALLTGALFTPQDALKLGLVDQLVDDDDVDGDDIGIDSPVVDAAVQKAIEFARIPSKARVAAKEVTRGGQMKRLIDNRQGDSDYFCSYIEDPAVQKTLGQYLERLSKRKK
jgi:3,2-trans-enoyl-CoA isomerase